MFGRLIAYIFLSLTIMTLGAEMLKFLEGGVQGLISISHVVNFVGALQGTHYVSTDSPNSWQIMLSPVLKIPIFMVLGAITVLLFFKKR